MLPANKLPNLRRRVNRARDGATCPASRHLHLIAERLASGKPCPMLADANEREHCATTMLAVLEALWKARTELAAMKGKP